MKFSPLSSPFPNTKVWGALNEKKGYVIFEDAGRFTASYRRVGQGKKTVTVYVVSHENGVGSLEEAIAACERADNEQ